MIKFIIFTTGKRLWLRLQSCRKYLPEFWFIKILWVKFPIRSSNFTHLFYMRYEFLFPGINRSLQAICAKPILISTATASQKALLSNQLPVCYWCMLLIVEHCTEHAHWILAEIPQTFSLVFNEWLRVFRRICFRNESWWNYLTHFCTHFVKWNDRVTTESITKTPLNN